ncbi:MAG: hypothetical protein NC390_06525 [Fusobacterium sp.]|nr:hypothetical protein [Fusobacterium sp.]
MKTENSSKQIESCVKMFALLRLLLEDNANFTQVIQVISDSPEPVSSDNSLHSVTLNKYLNTLKIFGLNVKKEKGKYHLLNPLYKIDLTPEELSAFQLLQTYEETENTDENTRELLSKVLKAFELRFSETTQMRAKTLNSKHNANFSFYYDKFTNKIDICTKFCKEDFKVEIIYFQPRGGEKKITGKAQELLFRNKTALLQVLDLQSREITSISLDKIISIKQLPTKTTSVFCTNRVVVFAIKGRLAKNYKLRKWEYVREIINDWHVIVNKDESEEELTNRILKYGASCKVMAPRDFKEKIHSALTNTLKLYEA